MNLIFAGGEDRAVRGVLQKCGVQNVLVSFFYVWDRSIDIEDVLGRFDNVVLDSGGFTMLKYIDDTSSFNHHDYIKLYLSFIEKHKGRFRWVANYDINPIVGDSQIYKWNKEFEQLEKDGQRVCYVSHDNEFTYKNLREYFARYNMVGVASGLKGKDDVGYFSQVSALSRKHQKLVHGFAMTGLVSFKNFPLYSADSTTYLGGAKFGTTYVCNGAYFETWDYFQKHRRKFLKKKCEQYGVNYKNFVNDVHIDVTHFNIMAWLEHEELFNKQSLQKQWWLTGV